MKSYPCFHQKQVLVSFHDNPASPLSRSASLVNVVSFDSWTSAAVTRRVAQVGEGQLDWGAIPRPDCLIGPSQDDARQDTIVHRGRHGGLGLGRVGIHARSADTTV